MTRKRLPRAITRTVAERHETGADEVISEEHKPRPVRRRAAKPVPVEETTAAPAAIHRASVEPERASEPTPLTGELIPPASGSEPHKDERRVRAEKIIDRYRLYAALGGLFPMPAVNVAGLTAINMRMVKALSDLYELPFEANQTRSMIMGLIGGSVPTGLGFATASVVGLVVPAGAFVGLAVSSVTAAGLTRNIGLVFIESFEDGTMPTATTQDAA